MAFCREMHDDVNPFQCPLDCVGIANITMDKRVSRVMLDWLKIFKISGIRENVQIHDRVVGVCAQPVYDEV
jgi:hypothetical protein